jgi:GNAT superfamily N-acetyltransferase
LITDACQSPPLQVRPISHQDWHQWQPLWDGYNAFYGRSGASALSSEITKTTWSRFFDPSEPVEGLVACHAGELVGIAHYLFHRSTTAIANVCYLQDLFVREDRRGCGVGEALVRRVCEDARSRKAPRLYWQTHETNHGAQRLYDRIADRSGFIVYRIALT